MIGNYKNLGRKPTLIFPTKISGQNNKGGPLCYCEISSKMVPYMTTKVIEILGNGYGPPLKLLKITQTNPLKNIFFENRAPSL